MIGLLSGANALYPEAGEPRAAEPGPDQHEDGFTSALWRRSKEITTADCRAMLALAGFRHHHQHHDHNHGQESHGENTL